MIRGCPNDVSIPISTSTDEVFYSWDSPVIEDNAGRYDVTLSCSATGECAPGGSGQGTFAVGITTVTYRAVDSSGNEAACSFIVHVKGWFTKPKALGMDVLIRSYKCRHMASTVVSDKMLTFHNLPPLFSFAPLPSLSLPILFLCLHLLDASLPHLPPFTLSSGDDSVSARRFSLGRSWLHRSRCELVPTRTARMGWAEQFYIKLQPWGQSSSWNPSR